MKKPIDPSLNGNFDFELTSDAEPLTADNAVAGNDTKQADDTALTLNETKKEYRHRHHSSSGGHSGEHSHSHHSSSGSSHSSSHSSGGEHHSSHHHSSNSQSSHHHSSSHKSHSSSHKKSKKKMPVAARIAIVFLVLIFLFTAGGLGTIFYLTQKGKNDLTPTITEQKNYDEVIMYGGHKYVYNSDVIAIAFIGVDKRELATNATVGTAGQADADLVLTVNSKTGRAKVIAVPRDTMVDVDLYSENGIFLRQEQMQLCLSYAYGDGKTTSAENVTTSISRILYNMPISKYFVLDLDGIAPINDAIGGVTLESLYTFENLGIKKGDTIHLEGSLTESYVRQRDMNTVDASLNRTARQVQYIKAFAAQLMPAVLNDFGIVSRLYSTAADYSTTNIDLPNVTYLASMLLDKGINEFETATLQGKMIESDKTEYAEHVYAEFYPDEDSALQTVLDTFYTQVD